MQQSTIPKIRYRSRALPVLVLTVTVFYLLNPYKGWLILTVGLAGSWLLAFLWARSLARGLSLTRELRYQQAKVGAELFERFSLSNQGWAPAYWVTITEPQNHSNNFENRALSVSRNSFRSWMKRSVFNKRGMYTFGPTILRSCDPLGVYQVDIDCPPSTTLLVLPPSVSLPPISVAAGEREGSGRYKGFAQKRTMSSASVREYVPGDSLRSIHWVTSARHDDLYVRLFDSMPSSDWWILLDMHRDVHVGEGENSTAEYGIALTSSLAEHGWRLGHSVGLVAYGEQLVKLPPRSGVAQRREVHRALALVDFGAHPLTDVLTIYKSAHGKPTSLIIVTPSLNEEWMYSMLALLQRGVIPTVFLLDPGSFGGRGNLGSALAILSSWNITCYRITPDFLDLSAIRSTWANLPQSVISLYEQPSSIKPLSGLHWEELG